MLAGSPENLCKKIRLRMVRECGVWGQSARCKAAGQGVVAEMCGAFAARRYLPSRLHSLQASSAQVGNSVQEGRHAMKCSIVTTQVPLTTTSLTLVECLSRAPRYSPSQSTGHTLRRAQCSASTGLSAALGDRLRRIETSIEDLSSYERSSYPLSPHPVAPDCRKGTRPYLRRAHSRRSTHGIPRNTLIPRCYNRFTRTRVHIYGAVSFRHTPFASDGRDVAAGLVAGSRDGSGDSCAYSPGASSANCPWPFSDAHDYRHPRPAFAAAMARRVHPKCMKFKSSLLPLFFRDF